MGEVLQTVDSQQEHDATAVVETAVAETTVIESPAFEPAPALEPEPTIAVAPPAPLVPAPAKPAEPEPAAPAAADQGSGPALELPLQFVNQLLARFGAAPLHSLGDLLPALRLLSLVVVAGVAVKLTGATLGAINEIPMMGRLLELVGLISALNFLARNALRSQKRAELLSRIHKLKQDLLG